MDDNKERTVIVYTPEQRRRQKIAWASLFCTFAYPTLGGIAYAKNDRELALACAGLFILSIYSGLKQLNKGAIDPEIIMTKPDSSSSAPDTPRSTPIVDLPQDPPQNSLTSRRPD